MASLVGEGRRGEKEDFITGWTEKIHIPFSDWSLSVILQQVWCTWWREDLYLKLTASGFQHSQCVSLMIILLGSQSCMCRKINIWIKIFNRQCSYKALQLYCYIRHYAFSMYCFTSIYFVNFWKYLNIREILVIENILKLWDHKGNFSAWKQILENLFINCDFERDYLSIYHFTV